MPDSTTVILLSNQGLYFGSNLNHCPLNPDQIWYNGLRYQDNSFNKQPIGIYGLDNDINIPLLLIGTKIYFYWRIPTQLELETFQKTVLASTQHWEPKTVKLQQSSSSIKDNIFDFIYNKYHFYDNCVDGVANLTRTFAQTSIQEKTISYKENLEDLQRQPSFASSHQHTTINPNILTDRWIIG